ncbi:hypothetical protein GCM10009819_10200 [Agromyces tropicus]|uniref:Uncharacterized protein n=1 Tax=Agromyces tropicus TaxID=555371 RepID=A0ABP5FPA5_9MICO
MNDDERDPIERLRAADPAADVEARAGFADDVVARATADGSIADAAPAGAAAADGAASRDAAPVADLAAARARRRRWLQVAAAAASVLVVGAAGYGLGASAGGGSELAGGGAAPPIALQGAGANEGALPGVTTEDQRIAAPDAALTVPYGSGRTHFTSSGLSTDAGTATAYAFDPRAGSVEDRVAAVAVALGIEGTPVLADGGWTVGPQDGTAPALWVSLDGTLSFSYSDPRISPWLCEQGDDVCAPSGDLPGEDAAIDALRSLIASSGRDAEGYEYTSETWDGAVTRNAQAWPVVDGQRVDQPWTIELAEDGIVSAYGPLADLVPLGDYAVVSEQAAFERLSDPRFGAQVIAYPLAAREAVTDDVTEWVPPTEPPAAPAAGTPVAWPVTEVEIVDARLGLGSQWQPDGSVLVVPAYEFTDSAGGTWSMIAVDDAQLDFSTD